MNLSHRALGRLAGFGRGLLRAVGSEAGQTIAEYGLILSVIAIAAILGAVIGMRDQIAVLFNTAAGCFSGSC